MLPSVQNPFPVVKIKIHYHICFGLFSNSTWSVHASLLIQTRWFFKQYYRQRVKLFECLFITNTEILNSQDTWWSGGVWIICGLFWCFYQQFGLSFWRHPFTAVDPLVSKWFNAAFLQTAWMFHVYSWTACQEIFSTRLFGTVAFGRVIYFK